MFVLEFYGPVNTILVIFEPVNLHNRISWVGLCIHKWLTSTVHILSPETDKGPSWISGRERMTSQMYVAPAVFVKLPEKKKKSVYKINENDLKIAWKCTLRQSNLKNFPGEDPRTPLIRGTLLLYSPPLAANAARYMPSAVNAPPSSDLLGPALFRLLLIWVHTVCKNDF